MVSFYLGRIVKQFPFMECSYMRSNRLNYRCLISFAIATSLIMQKLVAVKVTVRILFPTLMPCISATTKTLPDICDQQSLTYEGNVRPLHYSPSFSMSIHLSLGSSLRWSSDFTFEYPISSGSITKQAEVKRDSLTFYWMYCELAHRWLCAEFENIHRAL